MPTWDLFIARQFLGVVELVIYLDILHTYTSLRIYRYCTSNPGISQLKWPRFYELCVASIVHTIIKWSGVNGTCRKDKN